jgi:hypothetical protein
MTEYETLAICISVLSAGIAILALVKARDANKLALEANDISRLHLRELELPNIPDLTFNCTTTATSNGRAFETTVHIFNSGSVSTEIKEGHVTLHSYEYPEADQSHKLATVKIGARSEHLVPFLIQRPIVNVSRSGILPPEIICKARYSRPERIDGESDAQYEWKRGKDNFLPKN